MNMGRCPYIYELDCTTLSKLPTCFQRHLRFIPSEIANIYPGWLEENKNTLSEEDYVRYEKQYIIISEVCRDFEEETESSTEDDKQKRFERVLLHMQNMHELGQPPKELLLKLDPSMATNPGGVPLMPQMDQCSVM